MNLAPSSNEFRVVALTLSARDSQLTSDVLSRAGIECLACPNLDQLCREIVSGAGAVLVVEEALAGSGNTALAELLVSQPSWSDLPILVLARSGADSTDIAAAVEDLGNVTVLERPTRIVALVSAVRSALRARGRQYQVRDDAKSLQDARDELELRVRDRTIELREANITLEGKMREVEAAEHRARKLLRELVSAQETERARIARDLHDELGQQLTSLRLHLSLLAREIPVGSPARKTLDVAEKQAEKIDSRVSFLAWMIRPSTIEDLGLSKALAGYVREWSRNFDIAADFRGENVEHARLVPEIEINVYRIAQECLNNVSKYAAATAVNVLLSVTDSELKLIIVDNGVGFDATRIASPSGNGGLGLSGMQERASLLEGSFQIESAPGDGTTVYVSLPVKYRNEPARVGLESPLGKRS